MSKKSAKHAVLFIGLMVSLASCGVFQRGLGDLGVGSQSASGARNIEIDKTNFRTSLDADKEDRREMTITVKPVSANPEAALEAGRYKATVYCIRTYGGSDTEWTAGPDQTIEELGVVEDTITMRGRCTQP